MSRSTRLCVLLTGPVDTWSAWALATVLVVVAVAPVGWYYDDYLLAIVGGAAASTVWAVRVAWKRLAVRGRQHG